MLPRNGRQGPNCSATQGGIWASQGAEGVGAHVGVSFYCGCEAR